MEITFSAGFWYFGDWLESTVRTLKREPRGPTLGADLGQGCRRLSSLRTVTDFLLGDCLEL